MYKRGCRCSFCTWWEVFECVCVDVIMFYGRMLVADVHVTYGTTESMIFLPALKYRSMMPDGRIAPREGATNSYGISVRSPIFGWFL